MRIFTRKQRSGMVLSLVPTVSIGGLISLSDDPNISHAGKAVMRALRGEPEQKPNSCAAATRALLESRF